MVLQNLAWSENFFWDGRSLTLEEQILEIVSVCFRNVKLIKVNVWVMVLALLAVH